MAFTLPNFNLTVSVWRVGGLAGNYAAPDKVFFANLTPGRRVFIVSSVQLAINTAAIEMQLLLPKLSDIRQVWNAVAPDLVECPQGSHRFYQVVLVDDIAKGFLNEHRFALMQYQRNFLPPGGGSVGFPTGSPVPLP